MRWYRPKSKEIDIEGITRHGTDSVFYIVGSHDARRHSIFRPKDQSNPVNENRKRFEWKPEQQKDRERLIRLAIDPQTGQLVEGSLIITSLRDNLASHPVLSGFIGAASKENGIDIEGIASDGQRLYIGFRGPVLLSGMTPVLVFDADHREAGHVRYVALQGLGIRDLARIPERARTDQWEPQGSNPLGRPGPEWAQSSFLVRPIVKGNSGQGS